MHGLVVGALLAAALTRPLPLRGQAPRTSLTPHDFGKLQWLAGDWIGTRGPSEPFYERYTFLNDSTITHQTFADATLERVRERSTIALRNGRIVMTGGGKTYAAVSLDGQSIGFVPTRPGGNSFVWKRTSRGRWLATIRSRTGQRSIYEMRPMR